MLRALSSLAIVAHVAADECLIYQRVAGLVPQQGVEDGMESFCNHNGNCQDLYVNANHADPQPLSCDEAFARVNVVQWRERGAMPDVKILSWDVAEWSKADDARPPGSISRTTSRSLSMHMKAIEQALGAAAEEIMNSFPRVNQERLPANWTADLAEHVEAIRAAKLSLEQRKLALSRLRNADEMRSMVFSVRMILDRVMRLDSEEMLKPFLAAMGPFLNAFWRVQYSLRVHFPGLYHGRQAAILLVTQTAPPGDTRKWKLALTEPEVDLWTHPELPLLRRRTDWHQLLSDAQLVPGADAARAALAEVLGQFERGDDETSTRLAILFAYLDAIEIDVMDICSDFSDLIEQLVESNDLFPVGLRIQAASAVLRTCKTGLALPTRLSQVRVSYSIPARRSQLFLNQENSLASLLTGLFLLDRRSLSGLVSIESVPGDDASTARPGTVADLFSTAVKELFDANSGYFDRFTSPTGCEYYRPSLAEDAVADRARQMAIGTFLALCLREGFATDQLIPLMPACEETPDVSSVLFFGSAAIRRGFDQIISVEDFERVLIDGPEVAEMLRWLSSEDRPFFAIANTGIELA